MAAKWAPHLSSVTAQSVLEHIEGKILPIISYKTSVFVRYVDDCRKATTDNNNTGILNKYNKTL